MSLRRTLSIVTVLLTVLALSSAASTLQLTKYLDVTVSVLRENLESVRIGQQIEIDLLAYSRTNNPAVLDMLELELRQELQSAAQFVTAEDERQTLMDAEARIHHVFKLRESASAATGETREAVETALNDLRQYVSINVKQAHELENDVAGVNRMAERAAIATALVLLLGVAAILIWLGLYAFRPLFGIRDAMKQFAAGDRNARAPEIGMQELRRIAEQFNEMSGHLARQRENQLAFLTSVAHDLRNPIGALKMSASILDPAEGVPDEDRVREILAVIRRQIDHLNRMIGDLLDAYHIESGRLELRMEELDARDMVRDAFELFRYASRNHQVSMHIPTTAVPIKCDPGRVSQVLNNLLSNAIKYSPQGGAIVIALQHVGAEVLIEVSDNGSGIAPEDLPEIFEPFRRTRLTSREIPGVGLGLHVVKRIVEAHHGQIEVTSKLGHGTTFRIWIPGVLTEHSRVGGREHIA